MEKKQKKEYIQIIILSIVILLFAISMIFTSAISNGIKRWLYKADIKASPNDLVVHFINVGQGDAIAIQFPNGEIMLIDAGPKTGQNTLIKYIKTEVITSENDLDIDYMLLTHPNLDHLGGMSAVFGEFEVGNFYRPNVASTSENASQFAKVSDVEEYDILINTAYSESGLQMHTINKDYELVIAGVKVEIFAPIQVYSSMNSMSPMIKVSYMGKSFLFTGDIELDAEYDMINKYGDKLDADVLKVAHHGSYTSTSQALLDVVTPDYAVICVGYNNYGHPHMGTVALLQDCGAYVLTTTNNAVRFVCGDEMFGLIDHNITHSREFVDWWVIALVIDIVLIVALIKVIVTMLKNRKKQDDEV